MPKTEMTQIDHTVLINSVSAANTAAATSSGVDLAGVEMFEIVQQSGAITGTLDGKIQGSVDNSAWNDLATAANGLVGAQVTTANQVRSLVFDPSSLVTSAGQCRFMRYVGTVGTGPVLLSVVMNFFKTYKP